MLLEFLRKDNLKEPSTGKQQAMQNKIIRFEAKICILLALPLSFAF